MLHLALQCLFNPNKIFYFQSILIQKHVQLRNLQLLKGRNKLEANKIDPGAKVSESDYYIPRHNYYNTAANEPSYSNIQYDDLVESEIKLKHPLEITKSSAISQAEQEYIRKQLPNTTLFIQNIPHDIQINSDLRVYLQKIGKLDPNFADNGIKVHYDFNSQPALVQVKYAHPNCAKIAVQKFDSTTIRGYTLFFKNASDWERQSSKMRTVVVKGLDSWVKRQDVIKHMSAYGHVMKIDFPLIDGEVRQKVDDILDQQSKMEGIDSMKSKGKRERQIYEFLKREDQVDVDVEEDVTGKIGSKQHLNGVKEFLSKLLNKQGVKREKSNKQEGVDEEKAKDTDQTNLNTIMKEQHHNINKFNNLLTQLGQNKLQNLVSSLKPINQLFQKLKQIKKLTHKQKEISKITTVKKEQLSNFYKVINSFLSEDTSNNPTSQLLETFNIQTKKLDQTQNLASIYKSEQINVFTSILLQLQKESTLLKSKMQNILKNYGVMDKVLVAIPDYQKDPDKLPRHVPHQLQQKNNATLEHFDAFYNHLRVQELITIDQQRVMIERFKNISPAERYQEIIRFKDNEKNKIIGGLSRISPNFERKLAIQLLLKKPFFQIQRETKDKAGFQANIAGFKSREWKARSNEVHFGPFNLHQVYDRMLREGLDQYSLPLDALYQREKEVIHNYANAASDLRSKRLVEEDNKFLRSYSLNDKVRKQRDYLKRSDKKMLDTIKQHKNFSNKQGTVSPQQAAHQLLVLKEGISALEDRVAYNDERRAVNKGYCFVTFASSDQARIAVMANQKNIMSSLLPINDSLVSKIEVQPKNNKTHSDLDELYRMSMIKRDSKLTSQMARVRYAKRSLQKVETQIERRDRAGNVLDEGKSHQNMTRGSEDNPITRPLQQLENWRHYGKSLFQKDLKHPIHNKFSREQDQKVYKEIKRENGGIGLTELFGNSREIQQIKRQEHRNAFQKYKRFAFLKKGLNPYEYVKQVNPSKESSKDLYKYHPQKSKLLNLLYNRDNYTRILWKQDQTHQSFSKPGRQYLPNKNLSYTQMLQRYLGQDLIKIPQLDTPENKDFFGYSQPLNRQLPQLSYFQKLRRQQAYHSELLDQVEKSSDFDQNHPEIQNYIDSMLSKGQDPFNKQSIEERLIQQHTDGKLLKNMAAVPRKDVFRQLLSQLMVQKKRDRISFETQVPGEQELFRLANLFRVVSNETAASPSQTYGAILEHKSLVDQLGQINVKTNRQFEDESLRHKNDVVSYDQKLAQNLAHRTHKGSVQERQIKNTLRFYGKGKNPSSSRNFSTQIQKKGQGLDNLIKQRNITNQSDNFELSDQQAMNLFNQGEVTNFDKVKPPFIQNLSQYSKGMQRIILRINQLVAQMKQNPNLNNFTHQMLKQKKDNLKDARIQANQVFTPSSATSLKDSTNYFKSKSLQDASPSYKYVPKTIKQAVIDQTSNQSLKLEGYKNDYEVDNMSFVEYKEYIQNEWASTDKQQQRITKYQHQASRNDDMLQLQRQFQNFSYKIDHQKLAEVRPEVKLKLQEETELQEIGLDNKELYRMYRQKLEKSKEQHHQASKRQVIQQKLAQLQNDIVKQEKLRRSHPEIPNIQEYYSRVQENKPLLQKRSSLQEDTFHTSNFQQDSGSIQRGAWDPTYKGTTAQDQLINDHDMDEREWDALLYSGKMTAEQYGLKIGEKNKPWVKEMREKEKELEEYTRSKNDYLLDVTQKGSGISLSQNDDHDQDDDTFITKRDQARIYDTLRERRLYQIINSGEIELSKLEQSSYADSPHLQQICELQLRKQAEKILNESIRENQSELVQMHKKIKNGHDDYQKQIYNAIDPRSYVESQQYYFDPNAGVTLQRHVEEIHQEYPDITVETRQDCDGFIVVRLSRKRQYKYDLDEYIKRLQERQDITEVRKMEQFLDGMIDVDNADIQQQLREKFSQFAICRLDCSLISEKQIEYVKELYQAKIQGSIDYKGLKEGFQHLDKSLTEDQVKEVKDQLQWDMFNEFKNYLNACKSSKYTYSNKQDVDQMEKELNEQITQRYNFERNSKPLEERDFVKDLMDQESQFNAKKKYLNWQEEEYQKLIDKFDKKTKKKGSSPVPQAIDSYDFKNGFTIQHYHKLKQRIAENRQKKNRLMQRGVDEFGKYFRY